MATVVRANQVGRADEAAISVAASAVFGAALLAIPCGVLHGSRRMRRWVEALILQAVLLFTAAPEPSAEP